MKENLLAAGGVMSALIASTCCVVPLALVLAGVSGAWIGSFAALAPFRPLSIAVAVACLGAGFWLVYRRAPGKCEASACAGPDAGPLVKDARLLKLTLWIGAGLVALSAAADYGAGLFL
jgi:mercuric ion transport protein